MESKTFINVVSAGSLFIAAIVLLFWLYQYFIKKRKSRKTLSKHYKEYISGRFSYLDYTGLNPVSIQPVLLTGVYMPVKIKGRSEEFPVIFYDWVTKEPSVGQSKILLILGGPGSGKTTLLKWTALQCGEGKSSIFSQYIPFYFSLARLARDGRDISFNLLDLACRELNALNVESEFFKNGFIEGKVLFLLDGLDEIADAAKRREVIRWLESQQLGGNVVIVTARAAAISEEIGTRFARARELSLEAFDHDRQREFLENWFRAAYMEENTEEMAGEILNGGEFRELAANPLLLTVIAVVHRTRALLPKERYKLYEECLEVMGQLWNTANRKIDVLFSLESSLEHLSKIAMHLMKENRLELGLEEIVPVLPGTVEGRPVDAFLHDMVLRAGVLHESEGKFRFSYNVFREYLAAYYFARSAEPHDILRYRGEEGWEEVFRLFVNIGGSLPFFKPVIKELFVHETGYWLHLPLWKSCIDAVVVESDKKELTERFAGKIIEFMMPEQKKVWENTEPHTIMEHFAAYDRDQLIDFQFNNPVFIARELENGNYRIFEEPSMREESREQAVPWVQFDLRTVERLLEFPINFDSHLANEVILIAFVILKLADFQKLRELLLDVMDKHLGKELWVHALYIFKRVN